jgi:hypothetical protein
MPCCSLRHGFDFPLAELDGVQEPADAKSLAAANASFGSASI